MDGQINLLERLKQRMEMNQCGLFNFLLKKRENQHFYQPMLKKTAITRFDFSTQDLNWAQDYIHNQFNDSEGNLYHEIMLDVQASGRLRQFNRTTSKEFVNEAISFDFTIRAYFDDNGYLSDGNIDLLNKEQKALVNYQLQYQQELNRTGIKNIIETRYQGSEAFSFFTRIWKNSAIRHPEAAATTDLHYFHELAEAHRNVMYSVSCAMMWGRYISLHGDHAYQMEQKTVYPMKTSFYDNRHIFYLEAAMEELYTFYERIAHLLYIFLRPDNFEPRALSLNKLFEKPTRKVLERQFKDLATNEHYQWFVSRVKNGHEVLSGYRHPLIHYQSSNTFIKGSYNTTKSRIWMKNAMNRKEALVNLEKDMGKILSFVSREMHVCHEAFERAVLLCESLEPLDIEHDPSGESGTVDIIDQPDSSQGIPQ
ncbi:hypothetical protein ABIE26_004480 [Pedobacter africanus]|uniref:Uncharacterized protein n=1 Tax=Pedobacter africanus TaxID=151894 RepID=A0ACC6L3Q1_9SPHI|nr:hypothetical protein [Pedobacter africanus]MDR6786050.1 hypothetical protein [Pedobacter africanus]